MPILPALLVAAMLQAPIEVPFHLAEDGIIVDVQVNGHPVSLLLDTGFSGAVLVDTQVDLGPPTGKVHLRDFVGSVDAPTVKVKTLTIGAKSFLPSGMSAVQRSFAGMSAAYNTHIDGLLGLEALRQGTFEISFEKKRLVFYPDSMDLAQRKPDGVKTFFAKLLPLGTSTLQFEVTASTGKQMVMGLDTGNAFYATTHRDVLERVGVISPDSKPRFMGLSAVASGPVDSFYKVVHDAKVFGVPVKRSIWSVIDLPSSDADGDGTVGFGFLSNFNVTIDYKRRQIWLENFTGKIDSGEIANVGFAGKADSRTRRVSVMRVMPGSPAEVSGVREGDQILAIDGTDVGPVSFRRLETLLQGPRGTKVRIDLSRNGQLVRLELTREVLVNE